MSDNDEKEKPRFLGPGYSLSDLHRDLLKGDIRWLSTILALASAGLLIWCVVSDDQPEIYWPIHIRGTAATIAMVIAVIIWSLLAIANWINCVRARRKPK